MARQSLVWTALPNGYTPDGSALRLSLLLAPRLHPQADPARLDTFFPDWADWPATLRQSRFEVTCGAATVVVPGDGSGGANRMDDRLGLPDSTVWRALFTPGLFVRDHAFNDLSDRSIVSYDAVAMATMVQGFYSDLARLAGDGLPLVSHFLDDDKWLQLINAVGALDGSRLGFLGPRIGLPRPGIAAAAGLFAVLAQFKGFHTPLAAPVRRQAARTDDPRIAASWQEYDRPPMPAREDLAKQLDFHQVVGAMGSYPTLLRRLGLVVDLLLAPASFPPGSDVPLKARAVFPAGALAIPRGNDALPVTRTRLTATAFAPVPDPGAAFPTVDGLLKLDASRFALLPLDVDGAGLKLMNFVRSLGRRLAADARVDVVTRQEDALGAPSLRSAGLMLVQRQRAAWLQKRFLANKQGNALLEAQFAGTPANLSLHAEDLIRGWRIDIWDATTGAWASLCRRSADYALQGGAVAVAVPEEEATLRLAATGTPEAGSNADLLSLHEAMVTWNGWSLAAPPPGRTILPDDTVDTAATQSEAEVPPGLDFSSRFRAVPGSLPRLRFGRTYWIRARAVDLAGNSLPPQPGDFGPEQPASQAVPYLRYEPVAAPVLGLLSQDGRISVPGPGESMARLAIRSFNEAPADNGTASGETARRAALPPRVSVRDAEQHGMLDRGGVVDPGSFAMLAADKDRDASDPLSVLREVRLPMQGPLGDAPAETVFAVHEAGRALTYLPDPLARSVAARFLAHPSITASEIIDIPLYAADAAWPDALPFTVEVYEAPLEKPHFDHATRQLRVPLPKSVRATLRLSHRLDDAGLATLGVFALLAAADQAAQRSRALSGQHWMLTPARDIELVHAVQRPLLAPDIAMLSVRPRSLGQTSARPLVLVHCSVASTDRLDLLAAWHDPLDAGAAPGDQARQDAAFQVKVTGEGDYATTVQGHRGGGYPEHGLAAPDLVSINAVADERVAAKAHEFHDTRYRRIEYWFDATTRFREFMPASLLLAGGQRSDARIKRTGTRSVTWVPNAAPPPAPKVLYVVPTFGWKRAQDGDGQISSQRRGGGLRVYLDRPWNASGYGEMLAVVLPPAGFVGDPDSDPPGGPYRRLTTQWGGDPVWLSAPVTTVAPQRGDFPRARFAPDPDGRWLPPGAPTTEADQPPGAFAVAGLPAPSGTEPQVSLDLAPHDVTWDPDRQLWACDIEVDAGDVYCPFIRLALARYQPASVTGAHLSNIVLADFMMLLPDRWVVVVPANEPRRWAVTLSGHGPHGSSGEAEAAATGSAAIPGQNVVDVWIESLDPRLGEDFGWQRSATAVAAPLPGSDALWAGRVSAPDDGRRHRLVVAEYELYVVDDATPYDRTISRSDRRVVFVEHLALP